MQSTKTNIENQLRQEMVENKAHQQQIKKLQGDLLTADSEPNKGEATCRKRKYNPTVEEKLKIHAR